MSEMIEVKTSELAGSALDWAVAKVEGKKYDPTFMAISGHHQPGVWSTKYHANYRPSTRWDECGDLIGKHLVIITYHNAPDRTPLATTHATHPAFESGQTVLEAICRAVVAAKIGDTVQVPKELMP